MKLGSRLRGNVGIGLLRFVINPKNLRAWLHAGPVDRAVVGGVTFVATAARAQSGDLPSNCTKDARDAFDQTDRRSGKEG